VPLRRDATVLGCLAGRVSNIVGIFHHGLCQAEERCVGTGKRRPLGITDLLASSPSRRRPAFPPKWSSISAESPAAASHRPSFANRTRSDSLNHALVRPIAGSIKAAR
jgi:hypothetical protein